MRFIILTTFFSGLVGAYIAMPTDWQSQVPHWLIKACAIADFLTGGAAGVSRIIKQNIGGTDAKS